MINKEKLTPEVLAEKEQELMVLPPMTLETDTLLRDYYDFAAGELHRIPGLTLPATLYLRRVTTLAEVQQVFNHIQTIVISSMEARGRESLGKFGEYFWTSSSVTNLNDSFIKVG